jgi:hypothetical protein
MKHTVQAIKRDLTAEYVRSILDYDPETGEFRWKEDRKGQKTRGMIAGATTKGGYRIISIWKVRYLAHRLAWLIMTGSWPIDQIDHINHDPADNRWVNLRAATYTQNQQNSRSMKHGVRYKGVHQDGERWVAYITINKKRRHLGQFGSAEDAALAYNEAAMLAFGEFAHLNTISVHSRS